MEEMSGKEAETEGKSMEEMSWKEAAEKGKSVNEVCGKEAGSEENRRNRIDGDHVGRQGRNCILLYSPALAWQQSFLLGNGFMGQALYGQPLEEVVELSETTFFSGSDRIDPYREGAAQVFGQMREAAAREDFAKMAELTEDYMGIRGNYGTNLPVGKLTLRFDGQKGEPERYCRSLDLDQGLAQVEYVCEGYRVHREAFCSHEDKVFACLLEEDSPAGMTIEVSFDGGQKPCQWKVYQGACSFSVCAREKLHSDGEEGVRLTGMIYPSLTDGQVQVTDQSIRIENSHRAVLYLAMETDYCLDARMTKCIDESELYHRVCRSEVEYEIIKKRHTDDIGRLMGRQRLRLGYEPGALSGMEETDKTIGDRTVRGNAAEELLTRVKNGGCNQRLTELMYQYGRYLLLCSSREDSVLPTPLQGVWNDNVACRIGWTCDMHLDINTQMNYWISEAGALSECHMPLFRWMEQRVIPSGRKTAEKCYGLPGWAAELVSNAWGYAAPYWNKGLSPCPTGGIWQAADYMEHFRYTRDKNFLRKHAYPVLKEAVAFFLPYLFEDESGHLTAGPSVSPENAFWKDGQKYFASNGCTYEIVMIRELFSQYLEAYEELRGEAQNAEGGERRIDDDDRNLAEKVRKAGDRLLPYRILEDGTLAEWNHDYPAVDTQHRHTSHLLGLFPYSQITVEDTPELAEAAERTVEAKLTPYENWEDTGWARSMLMLYAARLGKGREAYCHLRSMQTTLTGPNLLVMHPPTRGAGSFMEVYELDGNTGFSMAVMEMLVQSHNGILRLLPALPEEWRNGRLDGAVVRGGIRLDLEWKDGKPSELCAKAESDCNVILSFAEVREKHFLKAGIPKRIVWSSK